jgi:HSP20 family protein
MRKEKKSFFEKLTGAINVDEEEYDLDEDFNDDSYAKRPKERRPLYERPIQQNFQQEEVARPFIRDEFFEGQLAVDVIQTPDDVIIKTVVAGVSPDDLDVSISRDSVTIRGTREEDVVARDNDYIHRELSWGAFSRTISLPAEIETEEAEAIERHGVLTIRLPKINRERQTRLEVRRA